MRRRRGRKWPWAAGVAGLAALLLLVGVRGAGSDGPPASPAVLDHIAARNRDAAIEAAARMKAESEAASRAADTHAGGAAQR